jgi:tripartite-type tricarboxylate transporter receptor subunit TctC
MFHRGLRRSTIGTRLRAALVCALVFASFVAAAQSFPSKPIKLVVPYPPGAAADAIARLVAPKLTEDLGQPIVIENRGGAGGNIGSEFVAKSAPDGYTVEVSTDGPHVGNAFLLKSMPYDPIKDFTPITLAVKNILVLVANPSLPVNSVPELIEYAKKNPGKLSFGTPGNGSPHHFAGALFNQLAGTDLQHVPYNGGGPAVTDLIGGQIPLAVSSLVSVAAQIKEGRVKVLAVADKERYSGLPGVPTIGETLPGFVMTSWNGFFAPARLPAPILARLHESITKALRGPEVSARLHALGLEVVAGTPEQFAAQQKADYELRANLAKSIGLQPE